MITTADLVLHPVRMQILRQFLTRPTSSAAELVEALDAGQATVYRHLKLMVDGGLLAIERERPERIYRLGSASAALNLDAATTPQEHQRYFALYLSSLLAQFTRYLASGTPDLVRDGVGYREVVAHLSDAEFARFATALNALVAPLLSHRPGPDRVPRLLATVVMPLEAAPATEEK